MMPVNGPAAMAQSAVPAKPMSTDMRGAIIGLVVGALIGPFVTELIGVHSERVARRIRQATFSRQRNPTRRRRARARGRSQ